MKYLDIILNHFGYVRIPKSIHNATIQLAFMNQELLRKASIKLPEFKPHYEAQRELVEYLRSLRRLI